jgi:hypothetical protein
VVKYIKSLDFILFYLICPLKSNDLDFILFYLICPLKSNHLVGVVCFVPWSMHHILYFYRILSQTVGIALVSCNMGIEVGMLRTFADDC